MKTGLHSVSYSGTWGDQKFLTLEQFIEKAHKLGYESIEIAAKRPHASPLDMTGERRKRIKELVKERNLEISCLASYHDFSAFFEHGDMAYLEKELVYMKNIIEIASDLGCGLVRTYTGYYKEGIPYRKQWERCVEGIRESAQIAADYKVTIGVQNHSCIASDPDSLLDFLKEVNKPNVKVILDAPFIDTHQKPLRGTVLKFKGLVVYTHLTDFIRRDKYRYIPQTVTHEKNGMEMIAVPVGQGNINYREFIDALKEIGFEGTLSYEMCSPLVGGGSEENLDRCAAQTLSYVKGLIED